MWAHIATRDTMLKAAGEGESDTLRKHALSALRHLSIVNKQPMWTDEGVRSVLLWGALAKAESIRAEALAALYKLAQGYEILEALQTLDVVQSVMDSSAGDRQRIRHSVRASA